MSDEQQQSSPNNEPIDPYESFLSGTFVPSNPPKPTDQEMVRQTVIDRQTTLTWPWPQVGNVPINEFQSEGYMSCACAFPTLFPTGAAEFAASRVRQVTIGNYFKHLIIVSRLYK